MKKWKIFTCFLLVCLLSLSLFGLTASASSANPPKNPITFTQMEISYLLNQQPYRDLVDMPYKYVLFVSMANGDGICYCFGFSSASPLKFSQGEMWRSVGQNVTQWCYYGYYNARGARWEFSRLYAVGTWANGSGDSLGYQKWNYTWESGLISSNPQLSTFPIYAYNGIPTIWEYCAPPSSDMRLYEKPIDNEPALQLPALQVGTKLGGVSWVDDDGNIHTTHGGGGGSFNIITPDGESGEIVSWNSGIGGILKNIIVCFRAPPSAAQPISITMWGHDYTVLSPTFFESSAWSFARIVIIASMSITVIVFLKNMILKTISAQGNGDGE